MISQRCAALSWRTAETFFAGMLHDRVARAVLRAAGIGLDTPVEEIARGPTRRASQGLPAEGPRHG